MVVSFNEKGSKRRKKLIKKSEKKKKYPFIVLEGLCS